MDLYITFYFIQHKRKTIIIHNGFSFGREKQHDDVDLFFPVNDINTPSLINTSILKYQPERIWCSISITDLHFKNISSIMDDRWLIGGPLVYGHRNSSMFKNKTPTFISDTMEEYLGKSISSDFDPYFLEFVKKVPDFHIQYNVSLGSGCYWGKCNFCYHERPDIKPQRFIRKNIEKIIEALPPPRIGKNTFEGNTCISSIPPAILKKVIDSNKKGSRLIFFLRPDKAILDVIKESECLNGYAFTVGAEGLSQQIVDTLNKNIDIDVMIDVIKEIIIRGGHIDLELMNNYTFLNDQIFDDYKDNLKRLEEVDRIYGKGLLNISYTGPVLWYDKKDAEYNSIPSKKVSFRSVFSYHSMIPENSEQFRLNTQIGKLIEGSTINHLIRRYKWDEILPQIGT